MDGKEVTVFHQFLGPNAVEISLINSLNILFSLKDKNGRIASGMRQLPSCTEGIPLLRNRWSFVPQGGGEVVVAMPHI